MIMTTVVSACYSASYTGRGRRDGASCAEFGHLYSAVMTLVMQAVEP